MLTILTLLVLLLLFWAYVRWDARRLRDERIAAPPRSKRQAGDSPHDLSKAQIYLGLGCMATLLAWAEWQTPSHPPFTGRWAGVNAAIFQMFGPQGKLAVALGFAGLFCVAACLAYWRRKK